MNDSSKIGGRNNTPEASIASMIGYGSGSLTLNIAANMFNLYFIFFATTIVGINPAIAGTISFLAIMWDAISDPIVASMSDNSNSKYGRRRPFMIVGLIPFAISIALMFTKVDFGGFTGTYYIIIAMLFWTFYTVYGVPYGALGAEMVTDFKKRNTLNLIALLFTVGSLFVVSTFTMPVVENIAARGLAIEKGWMIAGIIFAGVSLISGILCWASTKGKEREFVKEEGKKVNIIKTYKSILRLKPVKIVAVTVLLYAIGFPIVIGNQIFLLTNNLGLAGPGIAKYFLINSILGVLFIPLTGFIANKVGKRRAFVGVILISSLLQISFLFIGLKSLTHMLILGALQSIAHNTFFALSMSMAFDVCQIDEFVSGESREGSVLALTGLFQKFGYAIGGWLIGILLQVFGFIGSLQVQSPETMKGMLIISTVCAPVFFILSTIAILPYKMNEEKFKALKQAIDLKKEGKEYSTEAFSDVL